MTKDWRPHAEHVLDAIRKIRRIQARGRISDDEVLYDAALRNLQTLAESTQHLPDDRKAACPDVPWRRISGFRNILVHGDLGSIDPAAVEDVIARHLDVLEQRVAAMLRES